MKLRNVFVACMAIVLCALSANLSAQERTEDLFNGKDLSGWNFVLEDKTVAAEEVFKVENGTIRIEGQPFGYMYTDEQYDDFVLYVEWRYPETLSNSGIFLYVQSEEKVWPNAVEVQLQAGNAGDFVLLGGSDLAEFQTPAGEERPAFPIVRKREASSENQQGEWNNAMIVSMRGYLTVYINGVYQNLGTKSLHKKGHIALQSEGEAIEFKTVRLTPIAFPR